MRTPLARLAIAALVAAIASCARHAPTAHVITIQNFGFTPAELTVARGDTIVWTNTDFVPHSATARDAAWDSKAIDGSTSWRYVARVPGRYEYYCMFHPNMKATLIVR